MKALGEKQLPSSGSDGVLVIMAKAPRPGAVKARLASSFSPEPVTAFYRCILDDTLTLARSLDDVQITIMCPEPDVNELAQLAGGEVSVVAAQRGAGLAAGLTAVVAHFAGPVNDAPLPSTATAHTYRGLFSNLPSKCSSHMT